MAIVRRLWPAAVLAAAGVVVLALGGGATAAVAAGMALLGLAGVYLVSLAFYAVGRSEDRERAARRRTRR